jgi:hypothetical protein
MLVLLATPFSSALAQGTAAPPSPPQRPFDLKVGAGVGVPANAVPSPRPVQTPGAAEANTPTAPAEPAPRLVSGAPLPPQRPEPLRSDPADEEEEPSWPRRTPQQRSLDFEPRVPQGPAPAINGISTDPGTSITCLPQPLRAVMNAVVQRYGSIHVTSTYRPAWRARRNSFHRRCMAIDFRVHGQSPRSVLAFVKTLPETGGHKVYWNGLVHVDIGPWRTW